jgi:hypothetical protein
VTFPVAPSGKSDRVKVQVYRTAARSNAVPTIIATLFGTRTADITAIATAEAVLANSDSCVKPWALPDKWVERQTPGWDATDTFTAFPTDASVFPDIFRQVTTVSYTGYTRAQVGMQMQIAADNAFLIEADRFLAVRFPGSNGSADYMANITGCETSQLNIGDTLTMEGAALAQNTIDAANALIAEDPTAYWNTATQTVISTHSPSPRVVVLPVYEPLYFEQGKRVNNFTQIRISNFIGFFVDHVEASKVAGYIMPALGQVASNGTPAPVGAFARAIRLVE